MLPRSLFWRGVISRKSQKPLIFLGERAGTRTLDLLIKSQLPFQLRWCARVSFTKCRARAAATALERIIFGGLSLSLCCRPTVGGVRWHGTYRRPAFRGRANATK